MTRTATIKLNDPIEVDGQTIDEITLAEPKAGQLRGLNMQRVLGMDVGELMKLIPRISTPSLTPAQVEELSMPDFSEIAGQIFVFGVGEDAAKQAQKAALAQAQSL